jgi:hypothetical protein
MQYAEAATPEQGRLAVTRQAEKPCPGCGKTDFSRNYSPCLEQKRMTETGECFECAFWGLKAARGCDLVIDGWTYGIGAEPSDEARRRNAQHGLYGMGGRRFDIEFISGPYTGQVFTTHNLWCGGEIPGRLRDRLPNTARFYSGKRAKVGEITCWNPADPRRPRFPVYPKAGK